MIFKYISVIVVLITLIGCGKPKKATTASFVKITNNLNVNRENETVEIMLDSLFADVAFKNSDHFSIFDVKNNTELISQSIDYNNDGVKDVILFQPVIEAQSFSEFKVINKPTALAVKEACYSRFVPERTDDYAWENDLVAFRTFGPKAQYMAENNIKGGTLSSGIDAWLKRVNYPIIDKWYKKELETEGTYHKDTGEGLDNFHVGISRGVGGLAKKYSDSVYEYSKNFTKWKLLYNGPIRTSFVLNYSSWGKDKSIKEIKKVSLDKGSYLTKYNTSLTNTNTISVGLTLHENDGKVNFNIDKGFVSYWQPHGDSELGTAILADVSAIVDYKKFVTERKDESNIYLDLLVKNSNVIYYAGYGWKKENRFSSESDWINYLSDFSTKMKHPLKLDYLKR